MAESYTSPLTMISLPDGSRPALAAPPQSGWRRWVLAWSLATGLNLGMLALLATAPRSAPPPPPPLSAALRPPPAPVIAPIRAQTPAPPPPRAAAAPHAALTPAPAALAAPAPQAAPAGDGDPSPARAPVASGSAAPLPATSGAEPPAKAVDVASLPLQQRCPVQVKPTMPARAREDDISHGQVLARLSLDADGRVSAVTILDARPAGYFEAATRRAALQWRCLPGRQAGDSVRVPFEFSLE